MKQFFTLLSFALLITISGQINAQVVSPSGDIEVLINAATTRADLVNYTQQLQGQGVTLNITTATFNSANQVMTISFEVRWSATATDVDKYESADVRAAGDIWIIRHDGTHCIGDCK